MGSQAGVTALLKAWGAGDEAALERLAPLVYNQLHSIAARYMRRESPGGTLQTSALVNEAWLRLVDATQVGWHDRAHFFSVAAQMMRRILVDAARRRHTAKRGAGAPQLRLNESIDGVPAHHRELIALDSALDALERFDARKAKVVEMRFFAGLSAEETAAVLRVSPQTVLRDWKLARAWLMRELER